jgi:hypothetical protein
VACILGDAFIRRKVVMQQEDRYAYPDTGLHALWLVENQFQFADNKIARARRSIATQFSHSHLHPRNGKSRGADPWPLAGMDAFRQAQR